MLSYTPPLMVCLPKAIDVFPKKCQDWEEVHIESFNICLLCQGLFLLDICTFDACRIGHHTIYNIYLQKAKKLSFTTNLNEINFQSLTMNYRTLYPTHCFSKKDWY